MKAHPRPGLRLFVAQQLRELHPTAELVEWVATSDGPGYKVVLRLGGDAAERSKPQLLRLNMLLRARQDDPIASLALRAVLKITLAMMESDQALNRVRPTSRSSFSLA
jgi:hypothetical protein